MTKGIQQTCKYELILIIFLTDAQFNIYAEVCTLFSRQNKGLFWRVGK